MGAISISALGHERADPLHRQPVGQGVVERAQVGGQLVLHVARQEAQRLAGLHRRARQHDAADAAGLQRLHRLGDGEVGLAGAGGAQRHHQALGVHRLQQAGLADGLGAQRLHIALVAGRVALGRSHGRPGALHRQAAYLVVISEPTSSLGAGLAIELGRVELAFTHQTLQGTLGHGVLRGSWRQQKRTRPEGGVLDEGGGEKHGADRVDPSRSWGRSRRPPTRCAHAHLFRAIRGMANRYTQEC